MSVEYATTVKRLRETFKTGKTRSISWRRSQLAALKSLLRENTDVLAEALRLDLGRCAFEGVGLELNALALEVDHALANIDAWVRPCPLSVPALCLPATHEYIYEPYGVCLIISPFNYPVFLTLAPLVGCIVAGNVAVIKPSELSAHSEALLSRLLTQYLDGDSFAVVCGDGKAAAELLRQSWDFIFYTGSTRVGKLVAAAAAQNLTPYLLELGGKCPVYVDASVADIPLLAKRIMWGKLVNAGQTCIAPDYVLCHAQVYPQFVAAAKAALLDFYGEDPKSSSDLGRIVTREHCVRLRRLLEECGGAVLCGGLVDEDTKYVAPTLIADVDMSSGIMQEEIFGPLLPLLSVPSAEAAVTLMNSIKERPLTLYIFGKDKRVVEQVIRGVPSGGVLVNDTLFHFGNPAAPFGGVGESGVGAYRGKFSLEAFAYRRAVMRRDDHALVDVPVRYPPYSAFGLRLFLFAAKLPDIPPLRFGAFSVLLAVCAGLIAYIIVHDA